MTDAAVSVPRVHLHKLYRLLKKMDSRFDLLGAALQTGWVTDTHFQVKLPDGKLRERFLAKIKPEDVMPNGKIPPFADILSREKFADHGPPAIVSPPRQNEDCAHHAPVYHTITCAASAPAREVMVNAEFLAYVRLFYPDCTLHLATDPERPVACKIGDEIVGLIAPFVF